MAVRTRLTLWYIAVLASVLLIYGAVASTVLLAQLRGELDRLGIEDLETVEGFLSFTPDGGVFLRNDYHDHPYPSSMQQRLLEVWGADGQLLYRNELLGRRQLDAAPSATEGRNSYSIRSVRLADGTPVRVIAKRHLLEGRPTVIRVGFSEKPLWDRFWQLVIGLIAGLPLALGLAGFAGYLLARHALSPIDRMARRTGEINAERLNARLEVENPNDELGRLACAFNDTLARLERSFEQLRRFTSDASHELRTPLTAIRSVGEVGLRTHGSTEHYRDVIASMLEEAARLTRLVDSLLALCRADSGQVRLEPVTIAAAPFAREVASFLEALAEEKNIRVHVEGDDNVTVHADPAILRQVLVNLLDNAIKHSPHGSSIEMRVAGVDGYAAAIEVRDHGPGIPAQHRERVFDRFYRIDEARSRDEGGAGLGLAIAKWGAETHGGRLELECPTNGGCIFRIALPVATARNGARQQAASAS